MKKLIFLFLPLLALLTACQTGIDQTVPSLRQTSDVVFLASLEEPGQPAGPVTKVYADEAMKVLWNAGDCITIFSINIAMGSSTASMAGTVIMPVLSVRSVRVIT